MNEPRDTLVGDALRRLDVPDHAPDFWARLDAGLAGDAPDGTDRLDHARDEADDRDGAEVIELDVARLGRTTRSLRSSRRPAVAAAAAPAVAAIALGVGLPAAQQAADGDSQVDVANVPDDPAPDAMQPAPETGPTIPPTETTTTTEPDPAATLLAAEELAGEWHTLLRAGEIEAAWALLDPASQERLPLDGFRQVATGLAEGAGAFSGPEVTSTTAVIERPGGPRTTVVTFVGDVEREGMVETAANSVLITGDAPDDLGVAFVVDGPTIELEQLSSPTETRTSPVRMTTPESAEVWVTVDGSTPERTTGGPAIVDVEAVAGAGTHILTVVATEGGVYTAVTATVVVP